MVEIQNHDPAPEEHRYQSPMVRLVTGVLENLRRKAQGVFAPPFHDADERIIEGESPRNFDPDQALRSARLHTFE